MKPDFALNLSPEGISLLQRAASGWRLIGEVALNDEDMSAKLSKLRSQASARAQGDVHCKLVIPNDQIRYLTIDAEDLADEAIEAAIRQALDGATPYQLDELVYDWSRSDHAIFIAAVARETLNEAEEFALQHQFSPACFVATPAKNAFVGEPFFGSALSAAKWLKSGTDLERDSEPVKIVKDPSVAAPKPVRANQEPHAKESAVGRVAPPVSLAPKKGATDTTPPADAPIKPPQSPATIKDAEAPKSDPEPNRDVQSADKPTQKPSLLPAGARNARHQSGGSGAVTPSKGPEKSEQPSAGAASPVQPNVRLGAFLDKAVTKQTAPTPKPKPKGVSVPTPSSEPNPNPEPEAVTPFAGKDLPAFAALAKAEAETGKDTEADTPEPEPASAPAPRAKPAQKRNRLPIIAVVLALFLVSVGVALWPRVFSDPDPELAQSGQMPPVAEVDISENDEASTPANAMAPHAQAPEEPTQITAEARAAEPPVATLTPTAEDNNIQVTEDTDPSEVEGDEALDTVPETAEQPASDPPANDAVDQPATQYAVTGVWQDAPKQPSEPPSANLNDLYTASIDPTVDTGDAVALPSLETVQPDIGIDKQANPAAASTRFDFDERGLVRATPEGTLTPDGVLVYSGPPPVVPDTLPTRETNATDDSAAAPQITKLRPQARPADLLQNSERTTLSGRTREELSQTRPKARPDTLKIVEQAAVDTSATAPVPSDTPSIKPKARPRNFDRIVKQSKQRSTPTSTDAAFVASGPSRANVAREATVRNAIRLNQVNLIGVYGKPSDRRALIRLSNGRYKKVQIGDRLDGGKVAAIGEDELRYVKNGRSIILKMPRG